MFLAKTKGQAMVEAAIAIPIILLFLFGCIVIGTFVYNKAVVFLAANRGVDAGVGYLYDSSMSVEEMEEKMLETAQNMAKLCMFVSDEPMVTTTVLHSNDQTEILLSVSVQQIMDFELPLPEDMVRQLSEINATSEFIFYKDRG